MGKRGPQCTICIRPDRLEIEAYRGAATLAATAKKFAIGAQTIDKHCRLCPKPATGKSEPSPEYAPNPTASPLEQARANHAWLVARLAWASKTVSVPEKEVAHIASQVTNSVRLIARLSGALDVTEAQIIRSAPWARIETVMRDVLKDHPAALKAVTEALERLLSEGR